MNGTEDREATFAERVARYDQDDPGYAMLWELACAAILRHGGEVVVPNHQEPDPDLAHLVANGSYVTGDGAEMQRGRVSQCHENSRALHRRGVGAVWTGYALSADGLWREHTWVRKDDGTVVETTVPRTGYYGAPVLESVPPPDREPDDDFDRIYLPDGTSMVGEPDEWCVDCRKNPGVLIIDDTGEEGLCWDCLTIRADAEKAEEEGNVP